MFLLFYGIFIANIKYNSVNTEKRKPFERPEAKSFMASQDFQRIQPVPIMQASLPKCSAHGPQDYHVS